MDAARAIMVAALFAFALMQAFTLVHDLRHDFHDDAHETPCVVCVVKAATDNTLLGAAAIAATVFLLGLAVAVIGCVSNDRALVRAVRSRGPPAR